MKKLGLLLLLFPSLICLSQNIEIGTGIYSYQGDFRKDKSIKHGTTSFGGYSIYLGKTFKNNFEIRLGIEKFKLGQNEVEPISNKNFQANILEYSLGLNYHLNNGWIINKESKLSPYVGFKINYMTYQTYEDKLDESGNEYFYWNNGDVKDKEESYNNIFTAKELQRDYVYETKTNNKGSVFTYGLNLGVDLKAGNKITVGVVYYYGFISNDKVDNIEGSGNDNYIYTGINLKYYFRKKSIISIKNKDYEGVDYSSIEKGDEDKDGVIDWNDKEALTHQNSEVDKNGVAIDTDGDFVPDWKDQELNSPDSAIVDTSGRELTEEQLYINHLLYMGEVFPVEEFFLKHFDLIPEHYRDIMAELIIVSKKESYFETAPEEVKNYIRKAKFISTDGEKIEVIIKD